MADNTAAMTGTRDAIQSPSFRGKAAQLLGNEKTQTGILLGASVLCAFCATALIPANGRLYYTVGILPIAAAVLCFLLFRKTVRCAKTHGLSTRSVVWTLVLSILISASFAFGAYGIDEPELTALMDPLLYLAILVCTAPIFCIMTLIWAFFNRTDIRNLAGAGSKSVRWHVIVFLALLVCWVPVFLAAYPGFFSYDMGYSRLGEWYQYTTGDLSDHHSALHTLVAGTILSSAQDAGLSFNEGVVLLTIAQALIVSGIFTFCLSWMKAHGASRIFLVASFLFFAVNPSVTLFALCTNADTLFSAVAIMLILLAHDMIGTSGKPTIRLCIAFAIAGFFFCILRPNGVYVFIVCIPFLVGFASKTARLRMAASVGTAGLLAFLWLVPASAALHVAPSSLQHFNALSLPIQQISSVVDAGTLTPDEQKLLTDKGYSLAVDYDDDLVDDTRDTAVLGMDHVDLVKCWLTIGWNHPFQYLEALILQTQDAWNPYSYTNATLTQGSAGDSSFFIYDVQPPAEPDPKLPLLYDALRTYSKSLIMQQTPFFALLVCLPFYVMMSLLLLIRSIIMKDRACMGASIILLLLVCSVLLGPGVIVRYYLYLLFGFPAVIFMLFACGKGRKPTNHAEGMCPPNPAMNNADKTDTDRSETTNGITRTVTGPLGPYNER